jgi:anti-sigma factor RsiW
VTFGWPRSRDELALDHRHYIGAQAAQFASNDSHALETELAGALDRPVSVPDWEAATLVGGRACRINRHLVALILYERAGRRVSLFELPQENVRDGCDQAEGFNVCVRRQPGGGALAIVSDLPQNDLKRLLALSDGKSNEARTQMR